MSSYDSYLSAAESTPVERGQFIRRTYTHLAGAVLAFAVLEAILVTSPIGAAMMNLMMGGKYSWAIVMLVFMGITWMAQTMAQSEGGLGTQYMGLGLYVVAYAFLFIPMIMIAKESEGNIILMAGMTTAGLFFGLTAIVMLTKADFSFLSGVISIGFFVSLGVIIASMIFGFSLGIIFSGAMALLAGLTILYQTSGIFQTYRTDQYVAASVALFGSVALLFWYILRIFMSRR